MRNPLLDNKPDQYLPEFSSIRPEHVLPALESLLADYDRGLARYFESGVKADWGLVAAETQWADDVARAWSPVSHLSGVADSEALREVHNQGLSLLTEHSSRRQQDAALFRAYRQIADSPGFAALTAAQRRVVELELDEFRLAGASLDDNSKSRMREIMLRLATLGNRFSENVLDATRAWKRLFDDPSALAGLPDSELQLQPLSAVLDRV